MKNPDLDDRGAFLQERVDELRAAAVSASCVAAEAIARLEAQEPLVQQAIAWADYIMNGPHKDAMNRQLIWAVRDYRDKLASRPKA